MKKIIILINVILSLIFITGCTNNDIVLNTDEEVLQYINESGFMDTIGKENLSIIDTIQIDDSKIVTFLSNTGQGYIVCEKNEKGNYIMTDNMGQGTVSNELGGKAPRTSGSNEPIVNNEPKVGRNDPCPCGSGKKYKNCCGK